MPAQPIVPTTNILATSTISGTVRALKHITGGNINATSIISGGLTRIKKIAGSLNAVSTLSGAFILKPGNILPANIRATSLIHEIAVTLKVIPAGYYGGFDTEDGII